ncbi:hypothetical protein TNCV_1708831 [Trichonephila clavipes]|nr:hypothetical protein TNCV_1708831 [Trichonephila clavipes]
MLWIHPWCLKGSFLAGKSLENRRRRRKREEKESGERGEPALDGEKGLVRDWSGKTMNAGGGEDRIWTDYTGLAYELNSFASLTNCLANKQCFYFISGNNIFLILAIHDITLLTVQLLYQE